MLKFGVLLQFDIVKAWQLECVLELERSGIARLACVVDVPERACSTFFEKVNVPSQSPIPLSALMEQTHDDVLQIKADGENALRDLNLDFLLLFGDRESTRDLTDVTKYGMWYFAHNDASRFSSFAPCFWEIYHNHDVTGAVLMRIAKGNVAGVVLKSAYLPTINESYAANVEAAYAVLPSLPVQVCRDIIRGVATYFEDEPIPNPPVTYRGPLPWQILRLRAIEIRNRLARFVRQRFHVIDWNVFVLKGSPSDFVGGDAKAEVAALLPYSSGFYFADPCVVQRGAQTHVICERYRYAGDHGVIVAFRASGAEAPQPTCVIEEPYHLSYPHVFEHDGEVFCVAETAKQRQVRLYRATDFPHRWDYVRTLLDGFRAADSTLLKYQDKWWLFCTGGEATNGDNTHLYIWYSDDLYGTWTPHARNPVKIDARSSRSAGPLFTHANQLYRPAQDCSSMYGGFIRINRIDRLTETEFKESAAGVVRPPATRYNKGIHTISSADGVCVVDAKRYVFNPANFFWVCRLTAKNVASRMGIPPTAIQFIKKRFSRKRDAEHRRTSSASHVPARRDSAPRRRAPVLAICGGGNAGHALAVVTSRNFKGDVVWLVGSEEKAEVLRGGVFSSDGLRSTGAISGAADRVHSISSNPAEVIPEADVVMIAVPAFAHAPILKQIAPHLKDSALIGSLPTRGGFEFEAAHFLSGIEPAGGRRIFGLQTLPWSTRVQQPGKVVNFGAIKAKVLMATLPRRYANDIAAQLSEILGIQIVPTLNFMNMTLGNPGQVIHPGLMYGHFATWAGEHYREDGIPYFYAHATDRMGAFVAQLSEEIINVAKAVETRSGGALDLSGVLCVHEWLRITYPTQTEDRSTVASCFRTGPIQARKAPMLEVTAGEFVPNFEYRYLTEDVPFGLAITRAIAQIVDVTTPTIDAVLRWTERMLGKRYLLDGELDGPDASRLPTPQNYGIYTLTDLIEWYANDRVQVPLERVSV